MHYQFYRAIIYVKEHYVIKVWYFNKNRYLSNKLPNVVNFTRNYQ